MAGIQTGHKDGSKRENKLKMIREVALDLVFPRRCPFCGEISYGICDSCRKKNRPVGEPRCFCCGRPLHDASLEFCADCAKRERAFTKGRALYSYEKEAKRAIYEIKAGNRREYLEYFAKEMAEQLGKEIRDWDPQVLVPIPMYRKDLKKRGFNQAQLLAEHLAEALELPMEKDMLVKIRETAHQKDLDHKERRKNIRGAFDIRPKYLNESGKLPWQRVLLADDIFTTGSTLEEAAAVLKRYGVRECYFAVICIVP